MRSRSFSLVASFVDVLTFRQLYMWLAICTLVAKGCTTTVIPPLDPRDPVSVYLLDHGRSSSLVLQANDEKLIRYAYGDWKWYALRRNDLFTGLAALLWPTQGTLGRQEMHGPANFASVLNQVNVGADQLYELTVERTMQDALRARLEQIYHENIATLVENKPYGMNFVHHPQRYTYLRNSNHVVAGWLHELGCKVRGPRAVSSWKIEAPSN